MELRAYLQVLKAKWWIVLFTLVITYTATLMFTFMQAPLYQSSATFVVKLRPGFQDDKELATAVDILSRRTEIGTTFTQVADSRLIKRLAIAELNLSKEQRADFSVTSELLPGTNVLKISTEAHDPALARNVTNSVGAHTIAYVQNLYETYKLEPLDEASLPSDPISPNKPLNLLLGGIMGLVLGSGFALLATYLQAPSDRIAAFNIVEDETGAYNRRFLELRLSQELTRSRRTRAPLVLALINVDRQGVLDALPPQTRREALRRIALLLASSSREEDLLARFDTSIFALLLLDTTAASAAETTSAIQAKISATPLALGYDNATLYLQAIVGWAANTQPETEPAQVIAEARRALDEAEAAARGTVYPVLPSAAPLQLQTLKAADHE